MNREPLVPTPSLARAARAMAATACLLPLLGLPAPAHAEWVYDTLPGMTCSAEGTGSAPGLQRTVTGAMNVGTTPLPVLCPVLRTIAVPSTGYRVYLNGQGIGGACRLISMANTGGMLGSVDMTGSDAPRRVTAVMPVGFAPVESVQVVWCLLQPGAIVYNLEFVQ